MAAETGIPWTDSTHNPWWGCTKCGPACDDCYAEGVDKRTGENHWGQGVPRRRISEQGRNEPFRWQRQADRFFAEHKRDRRVFTLSMGDLFDNEIDPDWRNDHTSRKHSEIRRAMDRQLSGPHPIPVLPNVWLGVSVEDQTRADERIPDLLATPAAIRFISAEPLLGPVDLTNLDHLGTLRAEGIHGISAIWKNNHIGRSWLDWVIVGGESGSGARPMHPDWARAIRDQCASAGVPYFFKQWGEWLPDFETPAHMPEDNPEQSRFQTCVWDDEAKRWEQTNGSYLDPESWVFADNYWEPEQGLTRIGTKNAGRNLDFVEHNAMPDTPSHP